MSGQRAHKTILELGATDGTHTVALSGVRDGDVVITQPSDAIDDGTRVRSR